MLILRALFVFLMGISWAQAVEPVPATEADLKKIVVAMEELLRDASSARLKDVILLPEAEGASTICGKVNAKNAYGAYAGYTPFTGLRFDRPDGNHVYVIIGISEAAGALCSDSIKALRAE